MKSKNSPEPPFVPFVRPPEIEAMRNKLRAHLPEYVDEDIINNHVEPFNETASAGFMPQVIRIDDDGFRKIVAPDGTEYDYLEDDDEEEEDEDTPEINEPANYEYDTSGAFTIRSGAEWYAQDDDVLPEAQLFGDLWMQNDLCIMFADTNVGKSILAVQIADSISRGLPIPGFGLTAQPAPVLYFDFELSDHQFRARYSGAENGKYPFTDGFYRATLNDYSPKQRRFASFEAFISNEIENALLCCKAKTLIIDNITCLRYGTHNTAGALSLMQYLQGIKRTYQISILVLAHTPKRNPTKPLSRNDLQGSKMLINLADSAFAIGESRQQPGLKYLKQIKQRGAPETHGADNVCLGRIARTGSFIHFTFAGHSHESDHLAPQTEQYRRDTENHIADLHRKRQSIRQIAAQLGLAPTTVFRALKKLEPCGKEEEQCPDMQMCECVDEGKCANEEMPMAESTDENQYLAIQRQAPQSCHTEVLEVRPKPVPPYEPQTYDDQNALPQSCHTEAQAHPEATRREVRPQPVPPYEPQTYDDQNALPQSCHTEAQARPEATRREVRPQPVPPYEPQPHDYPKAPQICHTEALEVRPKPVPPYEAQTYDDQNALPQSCHTEAQARPEATRREMRPKPVPPYEPQPHDNPKAPQICHTEALEVRPKPVTPYEAQTHDDHNAASKICHTEALEVRPKPVPPYEPQTFGTPNATSPSPTPTSIIEIIIPPQKQRKPQNNSAPKIPGYKPEGGFLTIDDEIEGLSYLEKYAPVLFTAEYKSRLQLLKKMKEEVFDG